MFGNVGPEAFRVRLLQLEKLFEPSTSLIVCENRATARDRLHGHTFLRQRARQRPSPAPALDLFTLFTLFTGLVDQADKGHAGVLGQRSPVVEQQVFQFLKLLS